MAAQHHRPLILTDAVRQAVTMAEAVPRRLATDFATGARYLARFTSHRYLAQW